ncbi:MAG: hypothetical protein WA434_04970 [Candidatus Acidiferrales bacterium]
MAATTMRILYAGTPAPMTVEVLARLAARGFGAYRAEKLCEARDLLKAFRLDIVLAAELLSDGRGYALADAMRQHSGTLIVGVALSESCLWLPVIERGVNVLGERALSHAMLEAELDRLLGIRLVEERRVRKVAARLSDGRPDSDRTIQLVTHRNGECALD